MKERNFQNRLFWALGMMKGNKKALLEAISNIEIHWECVGKIKMHRYWRSLEEMGELGMVRRITSGSQP